MPRQRGIRARLNRIEGHAHGVMNDAQGAIAELTEAVLGLIEEMEDGFDIVLKNPATGEETKLGVRINLREDDD